MLKLARLLASCNNYLGKTLKDKEINDDSYFMLQALKEARKAQKFVEVPVGAIVVKNDKIIARGFNRCISFTDPSAHAEIVVLRKAAKKLGTYRLNDCCVYVTIEPCVMCIGAMINARVKMVVFGAFDVKAGACGSVFSIADNKQLNHRIEVVGGKEKYLDKECASLIQNFFRKKRSFKRIKLENTKRG
ncbi:MAG: tRNA adenosine(34) deaminase TadA [Endomicrobium sp.]|jgi:tRNA(adenine34) deaminase|nr:tRNA adenosine(34) deaminase TadA [Endomicrobium sp.]